MWRNVLFAVVVIGIFLLIIVPFLTTGEWVKVVSPCVTKTGGCLELGMTEVVEKCVPGALGGGCPGFLGFPTYSNRVVKVESCSLSCRTSEWVVEYSSGCIPTSLEGSCSKNRTGLSVDELLCVSRDSSGPNLCITESSSSGCECIGPTEGALCVSGRYRCPVNTRIPLRSVCTIDPSIPTCGTYSSEKDLLTPCSDTTLTYTDNCSSYDQPEDLLKEGLFLDPLTCFGEGCVGYPDAPLVAGNVSGTSCVKRCVFVKEFPGYGKWYRLKKGSNYLSLARYPTGSSSYPGVPDLSEFGDGLGKVGTHDPTPLALVDVDEIYANKRIYRIDESCSLAEIIGAVSVVVLVAPGLNVCGFAGGQRGCVNGNMWEHDPSSLSSIEDISVQRISKIVPHQSILSSFEYEDASIDKIANQASSRCNPVSHNLRV